MKYNLEFRYQIIVSSLKLERVCEVYGTNSLALEVSELTIYCKCCSQEHGWMLWQTIELRDIDSMGCRLSNIIV